MHKFESLDYEQNEQIEQKSNLLWTKQILLHCGIQKINLLISHFHVLCILACLEQILQYQTHCVTKPWQTCNCIPYFHNNLYLSYNFEHILLCYQQMIYILCVKA